MWLREQDTECTLDWLAQCVVPLFQRCLFLDSLTTASFPLWTNPTFFWVGTFPLLLEKLRALILLFIFP